MCILHYLNFVFYYDYLIRDSIDLNFYQLGLNHSVIIKIFLVFETFIFFWIVNYVAIHGEPLINFQ
jgi:hypothetical protein